MDQYHHKINTGQSERLPEVLAGEVKMPEFPDVCRRHSRRPAGFSACEERGMGGLPALSKQKSISWAVKEDGWPTAILSAEEGAPRR